MKRFLAILAILLIPVAVIAQHYPPIPLDTGPVEVNQLRAVINTAVNRLNTYSAGLLYSNSDAVTTTTTNETNLYSYTLAPGYLSTNGQALRVRCHAQTANTANNKTLTLYFGTSSITTGAIANQDAGEFLEYTVTRTGAATQVLIGHGQSGTAGVTPLAPVTNTPTETLSGAITIRCTATDAVAAGGTLGKMMTVETLR